ncbi:class I SAM-dependent methyltransferase [Streptomyces sp. XM4193]|uniref:N5-glutamine methyltransferase family protein n=1 Tax=Streptomyces sp. XM4193 TaxID=2929782 RepID=UPI001FF87832|nr:class I SAM-dependent methyltransferase [Streptomyces sp. XM4193]MCK1797396.1 class I SAM-dependent methyltransferase [Streptomyces sp. XM4193]
MPARSAPPPDPAGLPPDARPRLLSLSAAPEPRRVLEVDDSLRADAAFKLVCEGTALLWRGDFHGARQLLTALGRRADRSPAGRGGSARETFHLHRRAQGRRARLLGMLLVPLESDHSVPLRRAPDVREACAHAYGPLPQAGGDGGRAGHAVALRELLGAVGGWEWRRKGVEVDALGGDRVHPYHGVFSPLRGEYVDLVARAPLPADRSLALDLGTGTGVLAVVLARRGVRRVVATELDVRAQECARENVERLGVADRVEVREADLYPGERAPLVVCNPPWVPAKPTSPIEHAVYDPGSRMLRGFLSGLRGALLPGGEGWLILSDLAEHLELRSREELLGLFERSGLEVLDRLDARPRHSKAQDPDDPLAAARGAEVTSLWRLAAAPA